MPVRLHAAGSLREAFGEVIAAFRTASGGSVDASFGPSGLLKERIAGGKPSDLFASANMEHPSTLAEARGRSAVLFARNRLCALARPEISVTPATLLDRMLDPALRVGVSTPKADPSGDYAMALFAKADAIRPGARAALEAKALRLTGGPDSPKPPPGRSVYGLILAERRADIFLTYCTNAIQAAREVPGLAVVTIPDALSVGADYGLALLSDRPEAARLVQFILSAKGQAILAAHGFEAPLLPRPSAGE